MNDLPVDYSQILASAAALAQQQQQQASMMGNHIGVGVGDGAAGDGRDMTRSAEGPAAQNDQARLVQMLAQSNLAILMTMMNGQTAGGQSEAERSSRSNQGTPRDTNDHSSARTEETLVESANRTLGSKRKRDARERERQQEKASRHGESERDQAIDYDRVYSSDDDALSDANETPRPLQSRNNLSNDMNGSKTHSVNANGDDTRKRSDRPSAYEEMFPKIRRKYKNKEDAEEARKLRNKASATNARKRRQQELEMMAERIRELERERDEWKDKYKKLDRDYNRVRREHSKCPDYIPTPVNAGAPIYQPPPPHPSVTPAPPPMQQPSPMSAMLPPPATSIGLHPSAPQVTHQQQQQQQPVAHAALAGITDPWMLYQALLNSSGVQEEDEEDAEFMPSSPRHCDDDVGSSDNDKTPRDPGTVGSTSSAITPRSYLPTSQKRRQRGDSSLAVDAGITPREEEDDYDPDDHFVDPDMEDEDLFQPIEDVAIPDGELEAIQAMYERNLMPTHHPPQFDPAMVLGALMSVKDTPPAS